MSDYVLSLKEFGVGFKDRIIISSINLDVPDTGAMILMGPCGTGKSTLLRTLGGFCHVNPAHRVWGKATYAGEDLFETESYPAMVSQNTRLMISSILENIVCSLPERHTLTIPQQRDLAIRLLANAEMEDLADKLNTPVTDLDLADQRQLAIVRQVASNPRLLCVDEPTANLDDEDTERMVRYIRKEAKKRAILIITHNKKVAKKLGGYTALLAGGWIQEIQKTDDFFNAPISDVAKTFVKTGSCTVPSPDAKPEHVAPEMVAAIRTPPKEATDYKSHVLGPNGFLWLKKGRLAGTPRPGILQDMEHDLMALKRVGVTHLISLTERPLDKEACSSHEIEVTASPIPDMQPPTLEQSLTLCEKITELMENDEIVAIHCRAGLGRTGTMLASQLIYEGRSALSALEEVRGIESRWIQSESQVAFLEEFEKYLQQKSSDSLQKGNSLDAAVSS